MRPGEDQTAASTPSRAGWPVITIAALFALAVLVTVLREPGAPAATSPASASVDLASLPLSSTSATIEAAPRDPRPSKVPRGTVVHPQRMTAVYDAPDGTPFARIGARQFGDTWLPVITRNRDWVQVLLPSRPNGSTGWLRTSDLTEAVSRHLIRVDLADRSLALFEDGDLLGRWSVAIGADDTPTPVGRTFVLGQVVDDQQPFSPVILPLGSHSDTLDTYGGGPGTVALHGWNDPAVFGDAVSHGCVRVPDDALELLRAVPLGTPVMVEES